MNLLDGLRVRALLSLGAALLFAAILRAPIADIPLERDEGEYAYIGERWLRGEVPYRDAFDQKPPGVFLVYGAVIRTLGRSVSAIHWGAQIWSFGTVVAVWALARSAGGNAVGAAAGLLFSLLSTNPGVLGNAANTETFLILPATLSLLAALRARRAGSARWALAAGVLAGMATLFKQVALTNALISVWIVARGTRTRPKHDDLCIHVLQRVKEAGSVFGGGSGVLPEDRPWLRTGATKRAPPFSFFWRGTLRRAHLFFVGRLCWPPFLSGLISFGMTMKNVFQNAPSVDGRQTVNWRHLGWFVVGGALAWVPFVAWFIWAGAFREFWDSVAGYNLGYASSVPLKFYLRNFRWTFGTILVLAWPSYLLAVLGFVAWIAKPERRRKAQLFGAWLAASAAGVAIGGYFRDHYYIQVLPAVAVLAALGARGLADLAGDRWKRATFAIALAAPLYYTVSVSGGYYLPGDAKAKFCEIYSSNSFAISEEVGLFIAARTKPDDRVFIFGSEPQILFHANRRSATRYIFVYPLMVPTERARQRQAELIREVERASPKVVVTVFARTSFLANRRTVTDAFTATQRMLDGYRLVALALYEEDDSSRFLVGAEARAAWARSPMGYDRPIRGPLAVWEKR